MWEVLDLMKSSQDLKIKFPSSHEKQEKIASVFKQKSWVNFGNCVGCIDEMLVWICKPSNADLNAKNVGEGKFYCVRGKHMA